MGQNTWEIDTTFPFSTTAVTPEPSALALTGVGDSCLRSTRASRPNTDENIATVTCAATNDGGTNVVVITIQWGAPITPGWTNGFWLVLEWWKPGERMSSANTRN